MHWIKLNMSTEINEYMYSVNLLLNKQLRLRNEHYIFSNFGIV